MNQQSLISWITAGLTLFLPLVIGPCNAGCAQIKPTTQVSINPITRTISFKDTKNNDVTFEEVSYNHDTKTFYVKGFVLKNNSSEVIDSNVQQMMAFVEQQRAANEGITQAFAGLAENISALGGALTGVLANLPAVKTSAETPLGSGSVEVNPTGGQPPP